MTVKDVVDKLEKIDNIRDSLEKEMQYDTRANYNDLLEILDEYVEMLHDLKIAK